jgi:hypothetical protein
MKKKNVIKTNPEPAQLPPPKKDPARTLPADVDNTLSRITTKTYIVPRLVAPRWPCCVDEQGSRFSGQLCLGNGTQFHIGCFFDACRHFWVCIPKYGAWMFPAGQKTTWEEVRGVFGFASDEDAKNLTDFINSQLDGSLDEHEHVGTYHRQFCS